MATHGLNRKHESSSDRSTLIAAHEDSPGNSAGINQTNNMNTLTEHELGEINGGDLPREILEWMKSNTLEWIYSILGRAAR